MTTAERQRSDTRTGHWQRFDVRRIEDLENAVLGAGLDVVQMPGPRVSGSLVFAARRGVLFSSGLVEGSVTLSGPLSPDGITIGIGLRFGPNSRLWLNAVRRGEVGIVQPRERHDASLTAGSLYLTATLSARRLDEEASRQGLVLDRHLTSRTGVHPRPIETASLVSLTSQVAVLHRRSAITDAGDGDVEGAMLRVVVEHCARRPSGPERLEGPVARTREAAIVCRARTFITQHLGTPFSLETVAGVAGASRRTLSRAFLEVLNDTPSDYIRRLRLHQLRRDLQSPQERQTRIAMLAARRGIRDADRFSDWYMDLFGESPTATRAAAREHWRQVNERL